MSEVICGNCSWTGTESPKERCPNCNVRSLSKSEKAFAPLSERSNFLLAGITTDSGYSSEFVVQKALELLSATIGAENLKEK